MNNRSIKQEIEDNSMEVALEALGKSIARCTEKGDQHLTAVPDLSLFRMNEPTGPISGTYEPSICLARKGPSACFLEKTPMCMTRIII